MNVKIIHKALTLAHAVVLESVCAHDAFHYHDDKSVAEEALKVASELSEHYDDCKALVAIDQALKELDLS